MDHDPPQKPKPGDIGHSLVKGAAQ